MTTSKERSSDTITHTAASPNPIFGDAALFTAFMRHNPALAWMKDADGRFVYVNPTFERELGMTLANVRGKTDFDVFPATIAQRFHKNDDVVLRTGESIETIEPAPDSEGRLRHWMVIKFPFRAPHGAQFVGGFALDVTASHRREVEARHLALTDEMSGLYNRRGFFWTGTRALDEARMLGRHVAMIYVDVDGLKSVNDTLGHDEGDLLIVRTAQVLRETFSGPCVIGRIGGDEFAVLAVGLESDIDAWMAELEQRRRHLAHPDHSAAETVLIFSLGLVVCVPDDACRFEDLLVLADQQMMASRRRRELSSD